MPEREETFDERRERGQGERGADVGQGQVQAKKDVEEALGYVPSDGASLGGDEDLSPEALAEQQAEVNKQYMNPDAGGLAAEKPAPPHSPEAASSGASDESEDGAPAKSASREEWDEYAREQGVDPDEFSNKDDLIEHLESR